MHGKISDVLQTKGRTVHTISPDATVQRAVEEMALHQVGALVVVSRSRPIGMFGEREVLWRIVHEKRAADTPVMDVMSRAIVLVRPDMPVREAMHVMTERRVRHLPVVQQAELLGLVSIGDLTKWVVRDLEIYADDLARYIHGPHVASLSALG